MMMTIRMVMMTMVMLLMTMMMMTTMTMVMTSKARNKRNPIWTPRSICRDVNPASLERVP